MKLFEKGIKNEPYWFFKVMKTEGASEPISMLDFVFFVLFLSSPLPKLHFGAFWAILDQN